MFVELYDVLWLTRRNRQHTVYFTRKCVSVTWEYQTWTSKSVIWNVKKTQIINSPRHTVPESSTFPLIDFASMGRPWMDRWHTLATEPSRKINGGAAAADESNVGPLKRDELFVKLLTSRTPSGSLSIITDNFTSEVLNTAKCGSLLGEIVCATPSTFVDPNTRDYLLLNAPGISSQFRCDLV